MKKRHAIEVMARGVALSKGYVLLCHTRGAKNTYLPGGHVDFGESVPVCLAREIAEELGISSKVGRFLGVVEHRYRQKGEIHCEINLLFAVSLAAQAPRPPASEEGHLDFRWVPLKKLGRSTLEPAPLRKCLAKWLSPKNGSTGWAGTLPAKAAKKNGLKIS